MTRITIWETPDNREEYRDVACDGPPPSHQCGIRLAKHAHETAMDHPWRIYRDAEQPAREVCGKTIYVCISGYCENSAIGCVCDARCVLPLGHQGECNYENDTAAPTTAAEPATGELTLPECSDTGCLLHDHSPTDAGVEREQAARPRTSTIRRLSQVVTVEIHGAFVQCHGSTLPCYRYGEGSAIQHDGLLLCMGCPTLPNEVHFHNEAIV